MAEQNSLYPLVVAADTAKEATSGLAKAVGTTLAEIWQGIVGDKVARWRLSNAVKQNEILSLHLSRLGKNVDFDRIPDGYACTWFDEATKHEEPEIHAIFADLLIGAANGNSDALKIRNIKLASMFSSVDVMAFQVIIRNAIIMHSKDEKQRKITVLFEEDKKFSHPEYFASFDFLESQGLIISTDYGIISMGSQDSFGYRSVDYTFLIEGDVNVRRNLELTWQGILFAIAAFPELDSHILLKPPAAAP